jgi:hypothetical protein
LLHQLNQDPTSIQAPNLAPNMICTHDSLLQINLQHQRKNFGDRFVTPHRPNLRTLSDLKRIGENSMLNNLHGGSDYLHRLSKCLNTQMSSNSLSSNPSNLINQPKRPSSLLEINRAKAILAQNQLSRIVNDTCAVMSVTNNNPYSVNTQLMTSHDKQWNKNRLFPFLGTNQTPFVPMDLIPSQGLCNQSITKRNDPLPLDTQLLGSRHLSINDLRDITSITKQEDSDNCNDCLKPRLKVRSFPVKLMAAILHSSDEDIIAWLSDGKSFVVVNPDDFVNTILKPAFKECKYASFVRKLHRWGFVRLTSGNGTDCFHHPLFQKHRPDLCSKMTCTPRDLLKGNAARKKITKPNSIDKSTSSTDIDRVVQEYSRRSSLEHSNEMASSDVEIIE